MLSNCLHELNQKLDIRTIIRCPTIAINDNQGYDIIPATPATGILYINKNNLSFISGHVRMRGRKQGSYPFNYLEMLDSVFGPENNTIEVCSRSIQGLSAGGHCLTVDIDGNCHADLTADGQTLDGIASNKFNRWRCDPPYSEQAARKMYNTSMPSIKKLIQCGTRVCKPKSLLFLLLGPQNYQWCPPGVKRIGWIAITIVPNNELRALHIFYKLNNDFLRPGN